MHIREHPRNVPLYLYQLKYNIYFVTEWHKMDIFLVFQDIDQTLRNLERHHVLLTWVILFPFTCNITTSWLK